ncbi:MAG: efflux RND transporter periplasmic adaptor subunit [Sphingobacteriaceae bacterium]|nr:efflux RND transporter periplasmic adaptor subunit [Cytophagaceae bacterium]
MRKYPAFIPYFFVALSLVWGACGCGSNEKPTTEAKTEASHEKGHAEGEAGDEHDEEGHEHHEGEEEEVELGQVQYQAAGIQLGGVKHRALAGVLTVNGVLAMPPQQRVSVTFSYGGIVRSTPVQSGQWVNKGQVVATLENPEFVTLQQDFLDAHSQLSFLEKDYQRQRELSQENVGALKNFQRASADLGSLKARVAGLSQKLALLNLTPATVEKGIVRIISVRAMASGYVTDVNINVGKAIQPNEVLFELADTRFLQAELSVFEKDLARLAVGQRVRLRLAHQPREHMATVLLIGREISPERSVKVLCRLTQPDRDLLPGAYLSAQIEAGATPVPSLPEAAVVQAADKQYVFVAEKPHQEGKETHYAFKRVEVKTGIVQNAYVEVTLPGNFDLSAKNVVVNGAYDLLSKMNNSEHGHAH